MHIGMLLCCCPCRTCCCPLTYSYTYIYSPCCLPPRRAPSKPLTTPAPQTSTTLPQASHATTITPATPAIW
jgi:hypothetical protein